MSESGRAEEESERKTDEKKEDDQKMEGEVDIEAKAPGAQLDDGKGVGDLIIHFHFYNSVTTLLILMCSLGIWMCVIQATRTRSHSQLHCMFNGIHLKVIILLDCFMFYRSINLDFIF